MIAFFVDRTTDGNSSSIKLHSRGDSTMTLVWTGADQGSEVLKVQHYFEPVDGTAFWQDLGDVQLSAASGETTLAFVGPSGLYRLNLSGSGGSTNVTAGVKYN